MMFLRLFLVLPVLMMPFLGFSQLRIGPVAGASLTKVNFAEEDDAQYYSSKRTSGYHTGLATNYRVNERYSLHTEWLYMYRLKDVSYSRDKFYAKDRASLHYLAIPILYRVSFHSDIKKSHQEWYVNAGPALHYWMGGKGTLMTNEQAPFLQEGNMAYDIKFGKPAEYGGIEYIEPANRWQMALYAGGGAIFDLGFGRHIWLDARSSLGAAKSFFSNNAKGDFGLQLYSDNLQSSVTSWSISAGYFQDIHVLAVLKKGKSASNNPKAKVSKKGKSVSSNPKPKVSKNGSKRKAKRAKSS